MSQWKKVKIGDFLTEREGRYKPNNESVANLKRLEKIDFLEQFIFLKSLPKQI